MTGNELEIKGQRFGLPGKLQIEIYSPFLDMEQYTFTDGSKINPTGQYTLPFDIDAPVELLELLGRPDLTQVKNKRRYTTGVKLVSDGREIGTGSLLTKQVNKNINTGRARLQANFFEVNKDYLDAIEGKTLRDLVMNGKISIPGGTLAFWADIQSPTTGVLQTLGVDFISLLGGGSGGSIPSPMPYDNIFWNQLWSNYEDSKAELARTAVFADDVVNNGHAYFCFPELHVMNENYPDKFRRCNIWTPPTQGFLTYSVANNLSIPNGHGNWTAYTAIDNPLVPMYYLHQVLNHCFSEFGYTLQDDWLTTSAEFLKLAMVNTHNIVRPLEVFMTNIHNEGFSGTTLYYEQSTEIDPKNHLPDISIADFLRDLMAKFCISFDVKGDKVYIVHAEFDKVSREIKHYDPNVIVEPMEKTGLLLEYALDNEAYKAIKDSTLKLTTLLSDGDSSLANGSLYLQRDLNFVYRQLSGDDELLHSNLLPYYSGEATKITMPLSPVNCYVWNDPVYKKRFVPFVHGDITGYSTKTYTYECEPLPMPNFFGTPAIAWTQEENWTFIGMGDAEIVEPNSSPYVGFYHGLKSTLDLVPFSIEYPYLSYHNYQPGAVSPKLGNWHLNIIGAEGLVATFWANFIRVFELNNKVHFLCLTETWGSIRTLPRNRAIIIHGRKYYVGLTRCELPLQKPPIFECWEL